MNIDKIYIKKRELIEKVMSKAMSPLFDNIELDPELSLSTDENISLCEDLMKRWCDGGVSVDTSYPFVEIKSIK